MRDAACSYKVAKNRLAKLALKDTDYSGLSELLTGPTALATSTDPVAAAKAAVEFAKTNDKLEIVGGAMGGQVLDEAGVKALASTAKPRRATRQAGGSGYGPCDQNRTGGQRTRCKACPCLRCLRHQRSGVSGLIIEHLSGAMVPDRVYY